MGQQDPTIIMLDQIMRVVLNEAMKAIIWSFVVAVAVHVYNKITD